MYRPLCLCAILLLSACATQPPPGTPTEREAVPARLPPIPRGESSSSIPATPASALLDSVDAAIAAGQLEQAAALCERALRITPRDAYLWYRLAAIRFEQERYAEAMGLGRRAAVYAGSDEVLARGINRLLEQSRAAINAAAE